jgi:hypothetical protein
MNLILYTIPYEKLRDGEGQGLYWFIPWTNEWKHSRSIENYLLKIGETPQSYYDRWILNITSIKDRPRCLHCGEFTPFVKISYGYSSVCDISCRGSYGTSIAIENGTNHFQVDNPSHNSEIVKSNQDYMKENQLGFFDPEMIKWKMELTAKGEIYHPFNDPDWQDKNAYRMNSWGKSGIHISPKSGEVIYKSSWELLVYKQLDLNPEVISYIAEPFHIKYYNPDYEIEKNYYPDLLIHYLTKSLLVEIKPSNLINLEVNQEKFKSAIEYCNLNNLEFEIWTEEDIF